MNGPDRAAAAIRALVAQRLAQHHQIVRWRPVEAVLGDGRYQVDGRAVSMTGLGHLRAGQVVPVVYEHGAPLVILWHQSRRGQPGVQGGGGNILEVLYMDGGEVWFANDQQVTKIISAGSVVGNMGSVKWGAKDTQCVVQGAVARRRTSTTQGGGAGAVQRNLTVQDAVGSTSAAAASRPTATVHFVDPGAANQPLTVAANVGTATVTVTLATGSDGSRTTTAADAVTAIASDPAASTLLGVSLKPNPDPGGATNIGSGIMQPETVTLTAGTVVTDPAFFVFSLARTPDKPVGVSALSATLLRTDLVAELELIKATISGSLTGVDTLTFGDITSKNQLRYLYSPGTQAGAITQTGVPVTLRQTTHSVSVHDYALDADGQVRALWIYGYTIPALSAPLPSYAWQATGGGAATLQTIGSTADQIDLGGGSIGHVALVNVTTGAILWRTGPSGTETITATGALNTGLTFYPRLRATLSFCLGGILWQTAASDQSPETGGIAASSPSGNVFGGVAPAAQDPDLSRTDVRGVQAMTAFSAPGAPWFGAIPSARITSSSIVADLTAGGQTFAASNTGIPCGGSDNDLLTTACVLRLTRTTSGATGLAHGVTDSQIITAHVDPTKARIVVALQQTPSDGTDRKFALVVIDGTGAVVRTIRDFRVVQGQTIYAANATAVLWSERTTAANPLHDNPDTVYLTNIETPGGAEIAVATDVGQPTRLVAGAITSASLDLLTPHWAYAKHPTLWMFLTLWEFFSGAPQWRYQRSDVSPATGGFLTGKLPNDTPMTAIGPLKEMTAATKALVAAGDFHVVNDQEALAAVGRLKGAPV